MSRNLSALSGRKGLENSLFEQIGNAAETTGSPSKEALARLAEEFLMGPANLYGAASFYDLTRPENQGKKVHICNGTACMLAGSQHALRNTLEKRFQPEEIGTLTCLGRCHENGSFRYQAKTYSGLNPEAVETVIAQAAGTQGTFHVELRGHAVLTGPSPDLQSCMEVVRRMLNQPAESFLADVQASGLRGRGGAGFPLGIKLESCRRAPGAQKFIVCNADEGDPGSYSDRYLMEQQPLLVLLGMLLAGYAVGAPYGVVYLRAEYPEAAAVMQDHIKTLNEAGLLGNNILSSNFSFHLKIISAQGAYVCGEETALLASIEGQRPEVRVRPPYPVESGLFGMPTLVSNVETLANLYGIAQMGGEAYARIGTDKTRGTKLLSVNSLFHKPGVYEVDMGTPLQMLVQDLAGGFRAPVKALHIGGPLGGIVPVEKIPELTIDFESFSSHGFLLGHASVVAIPAGFPMIDYLEHLMAFTAHESCGKCFPCRIGSVRGMELLQKARREEHYRIDRVLFDDLLDTLEKGSLCALGGGVPLPIRNALTYFADELSPYFERI